MTTEQLNKIRKVVELAKLVSPTDKEYRLFSNLVFKVMAKNAREEIESEEVLKQLISAINDGVNNNKWPGD